MSDSNDQNKQKEVELLQNSIDHLKSVHLKLEATARAAKERREKAQQMALAESPAKTPQADSIPAVLTQPIDSAPMEPTGEDLVEPTGDDPIEIGSVVESLKLSAGEIAHEEFHGLHSK